MRGGRKEHFLNPDVQAEETTGFITALKTCARRRDLYKGVLLHVHILRRGLLETSPFVANTLISMYAKCGALAKAQSVLDELPARDVVSWSALIAGYAQHGHGQNALHCLECMQNEGIAPDPMTFSCILKACGSIGALDKGEQIHHEIAKQGLLGKDIVLGNAVVDMYAKCSALTKAKRVLEELPARDVVSWSTIITGYALQGQGQDALNCFEQMRSEGIVPDVVTFISLLKACGSIEAIHKGKQIHDVIIREGLLVDNVVLGSAVVDMYAKCGDLAKAQQVLEELPIQDIVSWNAMIAGCAQQGQTEQALKCFERMQHRGFSPNAVTLVCILKACSILGLVDDAHMHFASMSTKYGIKPDLEHYTCIVDVLGRAGYIDKAVAVTQRMPSFDNSSAVWSALLGACHKWGDVNIGRWAFKRALQVDESDEAAYLLMADIYTAAGMQEDAEIVEAIRMENTAWKKPFPSGWFDMSRNVSSLLT